MKLTYKVIPGSIASVQYVEEHNENGLVGCMTAVYLSERRPPEVTISGSTRDYWGQLPKAVENTLQERFDELFDHPVEMRQEIIDRTSTKVIEIEVKEH